MDRMAQGRMAQDSRLRAAQHSAPGCSPAKGQTRGRRGSERGGDDRRERQAPSGAAADGSLCGTEECLCC